MTRYKIISARKVTVKGEHLISLRLQKHLTTNTNISVTVRIHIKPIDNHKKLVGTYLDISFTT